MKKLFIPVIVLMFLLIGKVAMATTYDLVPGTVIKASVTQTAGGYQAVVSVTPQQGIVTLRQYYAGAMYDGQWNLDIPMGSGSATVNPLKGDRFQLLQPQDLFANISYEAMVSNFSDIKLEGVKIECGHPKGCAFQIVNPYKK